MSRINIDKLDEAECRQLIKKLLEEANSLFNKGKYDEAANHLIMAAKTVKAIPTIKRKEHRRNVANKSIKQKRQTNEKFVDGDAINTPSSKNPFDNPQEG